MLTQSSISDKFWCSPREPRRCLRDTQTALRCGLSGRLIDRSSAEQVAA